MEVTNDFLKDIGCLKCMQSTNTYQYRIGLQKYLRFCNIENDDAIIEIADFYEKKSIRSAIDSVTIHRKKEHGIITEYYVTRLIDLLNKIEKTNDK